MFKINSDISLFSFFNILSCLTYHSIFKAFLSIEKKRKKLMFTAYSVYFLISFVTYYTIQTPIINLIIGITTLFGISLLYGSSLLPKLICSLSIVLFTAIFESIVLVSYSMIIGSTANEILSSEDKIVMLYAISRFIPFSVINIYTNLRGKTNNRIDLKLSFVKSLEIISIPIISMVLFQITFMISDLNDDSNMLFMLAIFSIITINILFLSLYNKIVTRTESEYENILLSNEIKYYTQLYETINYERKDILKIKHNINNDLLSIKTTLLDNNIDVAILEIDRLIKFDNTVNVFSNILIIDAILNYKIAKAKTLGIKFNINVDINKNINIDNTIIANILGNALDNAIEACELNEKTNKYIDLILTQEKENLYIYVSNPYVNKIVLIDDILTTSKPDNTSNGIGVKTIYKLVEENNGFIDINFDCNIFKLEIILFSCFSK